MMHRDLKSPNVLLSEEGVAKIADVGMVRPQVQELVTAQPIMTPLWAAPEVQYFLSPSMAALLQQWHMLISTASFTGILRPSRDYSLYGIHCCWGVWCTAHQVQHVYIRSSHGQLCIIIT